MTHHDAELPDDEQELKSKTQIKLEMQALQDLGLKLVNLGQAALQKIPMDNELAEAVELARKINRKKDGFRRQIQFIGKLMRFRDTAPITEALELLENKHSKATAHFHKLEQLRDQLINRGDEAIQLALNEYPQLDRQKLRQLIRQANKQAKENKPPKASREIFQYLKTEIEEI